MKIYKSLQDIQSDLRKGLITCESLVNQYLANIDARNEELNAFIEVYAEEALEAARQTDADIRQDNWQPLSGFVLGIKDVLCRKGNKITAASDILEGFTSLYSSTAVARLEAAGAIIIGRLNCDEFAMGSSNENSRYGAVRNAADSRYVAGGSSGGSAAAVQAHMCLASLGTDTGGSVRLPAAFCGLFGLKPTYGRVSRYGLIAYANSFDQIGTLTHSAEDAASLLTIMAGSDSMDATSLHQPVPDYHTQLEKPEKWRIAYVKNALDAPEVDEEVKAHLKDAINRLEKEGHTVEPVEIKLLEQMVPAYYILTTAEASSNLARYDGVHFGYRSPNASTMEEVYTMSRTEGFGAEVKRRIMLGTFVLSAGYYDAYYAKGQKVRRLIKEQAREILQNYDLLISPTTASTAFKVGEISDPVSMYMNDKFTVQANLAGLPAISIPTGTHSNKLPYGLHAMTDELEEGKLLAFAKYLKELFS